MKIVSETYKKKRICKYCKNSETDQISDRVCNLRLEAGKEPYVNDSDSCGCFERDE